jgi:iron complex transport system ATP-binding protein
MQDPQGLAARDLTVGFGAVPVLEGLSLTVPKGQITMIIGPNGCGKSTLLRSLARLLRPSAGAVLLDGQDIARQPTRAVARRLGLLPQAPSAPPGILVADLVARGRTPHQSFLKQWSAQDESAVARALSATGLDALADHPVEDLSGGQRQRVWIAMVLAQEADLLLLDEPTTYLDLRHQIDVLSLLRRLRTDEGKTILAVLHDLNLAAQFADRLIAMREGCIVAQGTAAEVLTPKIIERVFDLPCEVLTDMRSGAPIIVPRVSPLVTSPAGGS